MNNVTSFLSRILRYKDTFLVFMKERDIIVTLRIVIKVTPWNATLKAMLELLMKEKGSPVKLVA